MEILGDLERVFATSLYPLRVPIAIALVVVGIALAVIARRRGWLAAAARHPARAAVLGVAFLAVALPVGWYVASPLFIRTELNEPGPAAAVPSQAPAPSAPAPSVTAPPSPSATATSSPQPTPSPTPAGPVTLASGEFTGEDEFHFGRGTASLIETSPGVVTLRLEDFSVRNGPDLFVYLSPDEAGYADDAIELGRLKATDGNFGYELPAGADPADFASAVIWCKQFAVQFAVAPLQVRDT